MQRETWIWALALGVGGPLLGWLTQGVSAQLAIALTLFGSGASLALLLLPEMSVLLWAGTSILFGGATLLLHTLIRSAVPAIGVVPFLTCLALLAGLLGLLAAMTLWRTKWPREVCWFTRGDVAFLIMFVPVLASTLLVASRNGYQPGPDGRPHSAEASRGREEFHARGFVNGDTFTLFALVNQALSVQENRKNQPDRLVFSDGLGNENPFAAGTRLEYPTLVHRALAEVIGVTGIDITREAWWRILGVLAGTVAVSVLSVKYLFRNQTVPLWAGVVGLLAFGTTWESFTYPQSHTFVTGLFILYLLLLVLRDQHQRLSERRAVAIGAWWVALLLLFSNAVVGTAAVAIDVVSDVLQAFRRDRTRRERAGGIASAALLFVIFLVFPPGAGALGTLNVAYTAIPQFLVAALPAMLVLWAVWDYRWIHGSPALLGAAVVLPALAFASLFLSARDIVAENSPRFLFLLVLLGWPLLTPLIQRVADWWWREVRHVEHTLAEQLVLWGGGAAALLVVLLPALASVTGTLDHLVRQPPKIVTADELAAFEWIRSNTAPGSVFARAPESTFEDETVAPLALPAFTGRAHLRSEYWLSPDDELLEDVRAAFVHDAAVPPDAHYIFCGPERPRCPVGTPVHSVGRVEIREVIPELRGLAQ